MKLLQRTGRYYILFSTLIFLLWGAGLFLALKFVIKQETDEQLLDAKDALQIQLSHLDSLPSSIVVLDNVVEISPLTFFTPYEQYSDTLLWNDIEDDHQLAFRKFTYHDHINGKPYRISVNKSKLDTEEMITTIVLTVFGILALLLLTINLFTRFISLKIWKPFYTTIEQIKGFTFDRKKPLSAPPTKIEEFNTLNQAIEQMTLKVLSDYRSLKQFTENASHEMQTPLAIIKTKIELLMQEEELNEKERQAIQQIQTATSRLSRLNQSLLLLTRIENRQYTNTRKLNLKELLESQLDFVEPLISAKNLSIHTEMNDVFQKMDPALAEVLIGNLLGNAIKHNQPDGSIKINLNNQQLNISNTGKTLSVPSHKLFDRFYKGTEAAPSLGLGLAIVKEICASYGFDVRYNYHKNLHSLSVNF